MNLVVSAAVGFVERHRTVFPRLLRKGSWAVVDQGLFAGSNFLLNVLLARWLTPAEYGAFTVAFATFLLLGVLHTALLTEPMLVYGPSRFKDRFGPYIRVLMWGHGVFSCAAAVVLGLAAWWLDRIGSGTVALALYGLALAQPFILLLWMLRKVPYARHQPSRAAAAGFVYLVALLTLITGTNQLIPLTTFSAMLILGGASLVAAMWVLSHYGLRVFGRSATAVLGPAARKHWSYGKWSAGAGVLTWVPGNVFYLLLPLAGGLAYSGALKALMNLVMPVLHAKNALAVVLVPELVRARSEGRFRALAMMAGVAMVAGALLYWVFVGLAGEQLMDWLYGGRYTEYAWLLWVLGGLPMISALTAVLDAVLRAIEQPRWIFRARLLSAGVALTLGVGCLLLWSLHGVVVAMLLTAVATLIGLLLAFRVLSREALQ